MGQWTSITERTARRWHNTFLPAIATPVNTHNEKLDLAGLSTLAPWGSSTLPVHFFPSSIFIYLFLAQKHTFHFKGFAVLHGFDRFLQIFAGTWNKQKKNAKKKSQLLIASWAILRPCALIKREVLKQQKFLKIENMTFGRSVDSWWLIWFDFFLYRITWLWLSNKVTKRCSVPTLMCWWRSCYCSSAVQHTSLISAPALTLPRAGGTAAGIKPQLSESIHVCPLRPAEGRIQKSHAAPHAQSSRIMRDPKDKSEGRQFY